MQFLISQVKNIDAYLTQHFLNKTVSVIKQPYQYLQKPTKIRRAGFIHFILFLQLLKKNFRSVKLMGYSL